MTGFDPERLRVFILELYEAASDPGLWPDLMDRLADGMGGTSTRLLMVDPASGAERLSFLSRQDPETLAIYLRDHLADDIRLPRMAGQPVGRLLTDQQLWSREEKHAHPIYQDFHRRFGIHQITGGNLSVGGYHVWFGVSRDHDVPFDEAARSTLTQVLPHLRQALRLYLDVAAVVQQRDTLARLWSDNGNMVLLIDQDGALRYWTDPVEGLESRGLLKLAGRRVQFRDGAINRCVERALEDIRQGRVPDLRHGSALLTDPRSGEQYGIRLMRSAPSVPGLLMPERTQLLLTITSLSLQTSFPADEIARFARLFGLTPAEERVLMAMTAAEDLAAYAERATIKLDTARKQVKAIMGKLHCRSQKDVVRMVERYCFLRV